MMYSPSVSAMATPVKLANTAAARMIFFILISKVFVSAASTLMWV